MALQLLNHNDERRLVRRVTVCPVPTDVGGNASYTLTWVGGNMTQIDKVMDGVTYRRTLTYSTDDELETVSVWTEV
jgi:hypothetical protein